MPWVYGLELDLEPDPWFYGLEMALGAFVFAAPSADAVKHFQIPALNMQ